MNPKKPNYLCISQKPIGIFFHKHFLPCETKRFSRTLRPKTPDHVKWSGVSFLVVADNFDNGACGALLNGHAAGMLYLDLVAVAPHLALFR